MDVLPFGRRVGEGEAEIVDLVQIVAEFPVVVDVDGCGVNLVTADPDGMLSADYGPLRGKLPSEARGSPWR